MLTLENRIAGVILGTAVGDALGLPREALSRRRGLRIFGGAPLRHRFFFARGMVSDDTEHTCMLGQALLRAPDDARRFARSLAWRLRFWLLGLPAGVGKATLLSILKLWLGFSPHTSGVRSAGNGPAMRAALLGVCFHNDRQRLRSFVRASTRLTHKDVRAEHGALLIAWAACHGPDAFLASVRATIPDLDPSLRTLLDQLEDHLQRNAPAAAFADAMGLQRGVTGFINHTVPLALYCWLRQPADFRAAVEEVIQLGGDTDTTGAIVGALVGATVGASAIPEEWLNGLIEWPRSVAWMRRLAARLAKAFGSEASGVSRGPLRLFWPGLLPRNVFFLSVVLAHGLRRLLPPY